MDRDPIVEEVRRVRETIAKEHDYNIMAIVRMLQQQEVESGRRLVQLPAKRISEGEAERKAG